MKKPRRERQDDMLPEYDFSKGVRGKYAKRYAEGTNVVVLSPDMAKVFPTSESVNEALRTLVLVGRKETKKCQHEDAIRKRRPQPLTPEFRLPPPSSPHCRTQGPLRDLSAHPFHVATPHEEPLHPDMSICSGIQAEGVKAEG